MPSDAMDIHRPYVAGALQWPIHRYASVCRVFKGFGTIEVGQRLATDRSTEGGGGVVKVHGQGHEPRVDRVDA